MLKIMEIAKINVLSLFDGMSCGQIALDRLGVEVNKYYASEIDKYAIEIAKKNYPNTIHIGDVTKVDGTKLDKIDLMIGGSPCQGFSFSGKQLNFADPRSALYFEFVRLLKESKPKYFLLENVRMKKEYQEVITKDLGVEPIMINSSLLSAQNRVRLYWTNIPNITQPKDLGILLKDVLQYEAENEYAEPYVKLNGKEKGCVGYVGNKPAQATRIYSTNEKSQSLMANGGGQGGKTGLYQIPVKVQGGAFRGRYQEDGSIKQELEIRPDDKTNTLTTVQKDNVVVRKKSKAIRVGGRGSYDRHEWDSVGNKNSELFYRKLTCVECERLMTVPDNYTEGVSNTQRYKMLGNGWSVDVIKHIFSNAIWT
jgi:DNA (cytosine-5)-methyltransferase 3A